MGRNSYSYMYLHSLYHRYSASCVRRVPLPLFLFPLRSLGDVGEGVSHVHCESARSPKIQHAMSLFCARSDHEPRARLTRFDSSDRLQILPFQYKDAYKNYTGITKAKRIITCQLL